MSRSGSADSANGGTSFSRRSSFDLELPALLPAVFTTARERQIMADPWQLDNPAIRQLSSAARRRNRPRLHSAGTRLLLVDGRKSTVQSRLSPPARLEKLPRNVSPQEAHVHLPNDLPVLPGIRSPSSSPEPRSKNEDNNKVMIDVTGRYSSDSQDTSSVSIGMSDHGLRADSTFGSSGSLKSSTSSHIQHSSDDSERENMTRSYKHLDSKASTDDEQTGYSEHGGGRSEVLVQEIPRFHHQGQVRERPEHIQIPSMLGEDDEIGDESAVWQEEFTSSSKAIVSTSSRNENANQTIVANEKSRTLSPQPPVNPKHTSRPNPTKRRQVDAEVHRKQIKGNVRNVIDGTMKGFISGPSRTVRLYISSTGKDMSDEMNVLRRSVFPRLRQFCEERNLDFTVIDLHSVAEESVVNELDYMSICLKEIEDCHRLSFGPSFVALIGNKYGEYLLPHTIPQEDFNVLHTVLEMETPEQADLLISHYKLDESCIPSTYRLNEADIKESDDPEGARQQQLVAIITSASRVAHAQDMMTDECFQRLHTTALEMELSHGIFKIKGAKKKATAYCRELDGILEDLENPLTSNYIDTHVQGKTVAVNLECVDTLNHIKQNKLKRHMGESNVHCYTPWWQKNGLDSSNNQRNSNYLNLLSRHFLEDMKRLINSATKGHNSAWKLIGVDAMEVFEDVSHHLAIAKMENEGYIDLHDGLDQVKRFLMEQPRQGVFIHGNSGCGKTAFISELAKKSEDLLGQSCACVIRFLNHAPAQSDWRSVVISICKQIHTAYDTGDTNLSGMKDSGLISHFKTLLEEVSKVIQTRGKDEGLILMMDSIHVLSDLSWIPKSFPKGIYFICTTCDRLSKLSENANVVNLETLSSEKALQFCKSIFDMKCCRLNENVLNTCQGSLVENMTPLEVKLLASGLASTYNGKRNTSPPTSTHDALSEIFNELERNVDARIAKASIGYLSVSYDGLTENDFENIVFGNENVRSLIQSRQMGEDTNSEELVEEPSLISFEMAIIRRTLDLLVTRSESRGRLFIKWSSPIIHQFAVSRYFTKEGDQSSFHTDLLHYYLRKIKVYNQTVHSSRLEETLPKCDVERVHRLIMYHLAHSNISLVSAKQLFFCNFQWLSQKLHFSSISSIIQDIKYFNATFHSDQDDEIMKVLRCLSTSLSTFSHERKDSLDETKMDLFLILKTYLVADTETDIMTQQLLDEGKEISLKMEVDYLLPVYPTRKIAIEKLLEGDRMEFFHEYRTHYIMEMSSTAKGRILDLNNMETICHRGVMSAEGNQPDFCRVTISPDGRNAVTIEEGFVTLQELQSGIVTKRFSLEDENGKVMLKDFTVNFDDLILIAVTSDDILMTISIMDNEIIGRFPADTDDVNIVCAEKQQLTVDDIEDGERSPSADKSVENDLDMPPQTEEGNDEVEGKLTQGLNENRNSPSNEKQEEQHKDAKGMDDGAAVVVENEHISQGSVNQNENDEKVENEQSDITDKHPEQINSEQAKEQETLNARTTQARENTKDERDSTLIQDKEGFSEIQKYPGDNRLIGIGDSDHEEITCMKLSPNQHILGVTTKSNCGCSLHLWNIETWVKSEALIFKDFGCSDFYFSPNSSVMVLNLIPQNYAVINIATCTIDLEIQDSKCDDSSLRLQTPCVTFSKDSQHVVLPTAKTEISVFDTANGTCTQQFQSKERCTLLALDDSEMFLFACEGLASVSIWHTVIGQKIWSISPDCNKIGDLIIDTGKGGTYLYTITDGTTCYSWNVSDILEECQAKLQYLDNGQHINNISGLNLDSQVSSGLEINLETDFNFESKIQESIDCPGVASLHHDVALTPDGRFIITANRQLGIRIYDITTTKHMSTIECPDVWNVIVANDGLTLVCITHSKHLLFYTLEKDRWQLIDRLHNITHLAVDGISISADGRTIVVIRVDDFHRDHVHIYVIDLVTCHVMVHLMVDVEIKDLKYKSLSSKLSHDFSRLLITYHSYDASPSHFVVCDLYKELNMGLPSWTLGSPSTVFSSASRIVTPLGISVEDHGSQFAEDGYPCLDHVEVTGSFGSTPGLLGVPLSERDQMDHIYPVYPSTIHPEVSDTTNFGFISINVFEDNTLPEHLNQQVNEQQSPGLLGAGLLPSANIDINLDARVTSYPTASVINEGSLDVLQSTQNFLDPQNLREIGEQSKIPKSGTGTESMGSIKNENNLDVIQESNEDDMESKASHSQGMNNESENREMTDNKSADTVVQKPNTSDENSIESINELPKTKSGDKPVTQPSPEQDQKSNGQDLGDGNKGQEVNYEVEGTTEDKASSSSGQNENQILDSAHRPVSGSSVKTVASASKEERLSSTHQGQQVDQDRGTVDKQIRVQPPEEQSEEQDHPQSLPQNSGRFKRLDSLTLIPLAHPVRQTSEMSLNLPFDMDDEPPGDSENPTGRRRSVGHLVRYAHLVVDHPEKCTATLEGSDIIVGTCKGNLVILDLHTATLKHAMLQKPQGNTEYMNDILEVEMDTTKPLVISEEYMPHRDSITHVSRSRDFRYVIASSADKTITVWQMEGLKFLHRLEGHTDKVTWSEISGDNSLIVSGSDDKSVRLWELKTGNPLHCFKVLYPVFEVRFSFGDVHVMARQGRSGYGRFTVFKVHRSPQNVAPKLLA